jgi:rubredoxin
MSQFRCSRCGRARRPDELRDFGHPLETIAAREQPDEFPFATLQPWTSIDGLHVCPQCQTAQERRDLAATIISAVEAEITKNREEAADPLPHEAALIAFALKLRD